MIHYGTASKILGLWLAAWVFTSCATSPEECSPQNVNNVLKAGSCLIGGGMVEAVEHQRRELERLFQQRQLTEVETLALQKQSSRFAQEISSYRKELDERKGEIESLQMNLDQFIASNTEERAKKQVLKEAIVQLNSELESEQLKTQVSQDEVFNLVRDLERRRAVIQVLTADILVE